MHTLTRHHVETEIQMKTTFITFIVSVRDKLPYFRIFILQKPVTVKLFATEKGIKIDAN